MRFWGWIAFSESWAWSEFLQTSVSPEWMWNKTSGSLCWVTRARRDMVGGVRSLYLGDNEHQMDDDFLLRIISQCL